MSDVSQGAGWWQASDGRWYPPQSHPDYRAPEPQPQPQLEIDALPQPQVEVESQRQQGAHPDPEPVPVPERQPPTQSMERPSGLPVRPSPLDREAALAVLAELQEVERSLWAVRDELRKLLEDGQGT